MSLPRSDKNPAGVGGITNLPRKPQLAQAPHRRLASYEKSYGQRSTIAKRATNAGRAAGAASDAADMKNALKGQPTYAGVPVPPQSNIGKLVTDRAHQAHLDREHNLNQGAGQVGNPYHDRKGKFTSASGAT